ncbi:type II CAAX endopeptidase family protein [Cloacibacterium sp. Arc13]|uniref:CPBP family intramembrane glutamic endopeptidase n=1 Tax=unclassified Cloacibacterium TaxID=2620870 RepID=UPI00352F011E
MSIDNTKYRNYIFDFKAAAALFAGLFIGIMVLGLYTLFAYFILKQGYAEIQSSMVFFIVSYLCTVLFPIIGFDVFVMKSQGKKLNFNMQTRPFHVYLMIFPMMLGMMLVSEFLVSRIPIEGEFFGPLYDQMSDAFSTIATDTAGIYLLTVLFAPFLEEILFRGIIQKGLINKGVKPAKAIIFSALAFGIFHLNPWQTVNAFLLGLVLGVVYYKTKSLLMPILLHAFNNFISAYLLLNGNSESVTENLHLSEYYGLIVGIVLLSVSYYLFMYRNRIYYRE